MELPNKERHNCLSAVPGRDGDTVNNLEVLDKLRQRCEICDQTMLRTSFERHLNTGRHKKKLEPTASVHQQPQQANANHIQPQQQRINSGI